MIVAFEPDTRGIDALSGELDDSVTMPTLVWDQLIKDMGDIPGRPHIEPFDQEPWQQLPTLEELSVLWGASPVFMLIGDIVNRLDVPDVPKFLAEQRFMAEIELGWIKEREARDAVNVEQDPDSTGSAQHGPVGTIDARGGGQDLPCGSEDGDTVGEDKEDCGDPHGGGTQKVPRRRRAGGSGKRLGVKGVHTNSAEDPQAAAAFETDDDPLCGVVHSDAAGGSGDVPVA